MIKELIKIANKLDERGLVEQSNRLDLIIKKLAEPDSHDYHFGFGPDEKIDLLPPLPPGQTQKTTDQTVFVVTHDIDFEGSTVEGVFSSKDKAQAAIDAAGETISYAQYSINEHNIDDASGVG
jgi:hypothetical protein